MFMSLTSHEKTLASSLLEYEAGTKAEINKAKRAARGKYWKNARDKEYVAFSPKGTRKYFSYSDDKIETVKECAKLWARGEMKEAREKYLEFIVSPVRDRIKEKQSP